jgi:hypothetical protein
MRKIAEIERSPWRMEGQGGNLGFGSQDVQDQERDLIMEQRRPKGRN